MAAFMLARVSAQKAGQTLFYMQAVDQALTLIQRASREEFYEEILHIPSLSATKRQARCCANILHELCHGL